MVGSEQGLAELVDHTGAAQLGERIAGRACRDDRAVGKHVGGPVMVGDDDLEATRLASAISSTAVTPQSTVTTSPTPSSSSRSSVSPETP